ncbi:MAG: type IV pilus assembly protein PilE [Halioglobus sp.]
MASSCSASTTNLYGFTLIELMIVLAISGILLLFALPTYQQYQLKTKRALAGGELLAVLARQEQFFANNKQYAPTLDLLGYSGNPYSINANIVDVPVSAVDRIYTIELNLTAPTYFELKAIPQLFQAKDSLCGTLKLTSRGGKSASTGVGNLCW